MSDVISRFTAAGAEEYAADVGKMATATDELTQSTKQAEAAQKSFRTQAREMKEALTALAVAGKQNTEEYKKLRDEAGRLNDAMRDVSEELSTAGSDTRGLDKALRATSVLVGGFTAVQGAAALFGDESEDLQKTLLKVNAAMSLLNGLQAIQAELTRKDSMFTQAAAKAKELYAKAVGNASIATKAFTIALTGGLLFALGLLITNWDKIVGAINRFVDATYDARKAAEALTKAHQKENDELEYQLKLMKARGVEDEKQLILTNNTRARQLDDLKRQLETQKQLLAIEEKGRLVGSERQGFVTSKDIGAINTYKAEIAKTEEAIKNARLAFLEANRSLQDYSTSQAKGAEETDKATAAIVRQNEALKDSTTARQQSSREQRAVTEIQNIEATAAQETADLKANIDLESLQAHIEILKQKLAADAEYDKKVRLQDTARFKERSRMAQQAFDVAARFEQSLFQIVDNSFALQQQNLEEKRAKGLITEKQYAKEIAKLQQKQLKASKATGIVEATINGAVAALKAFAELGPIGGAIAAALIAGITATQIALIAKQKIPNVPGFFKGTKDAPPGMKWVGERGPELVNDKGGYAIIPAGESQRIADMYKKWDIPTITVPELVSKKPAYQPPSSDRLSKIVFQQNNTELVTELRFIGNYIRQGNSADFKSLDQLKTISDKMTRRGFRT